MVYADEVIVLGQELRERRGAELCLVKAPIREIKEPVLEDGRPHSIPVTLAGTPCKLEGGEDKGSSFAVLVECLHGQEFTMP
ncbi:MAG: hypothetical protein ACRDYA_08100 [Egibacteraceae bacterium]